MMERIWTILQRRKLYSAPKMFLVEIPGNVRFMHGEKSAQRNTCEIIKLTRDVSEKTPPVTSGVRTCGIGTVCHIFRFPCLENGCTIFLFFPALRKRHMFRSPGKNRICPSCWKKNPPAENQISSPTLRKIVIRTKHKHNVLTKSDIIVQEKSMRESASADVIFVAS